MKKTWVSMNADEERLILRALNALRNELIADGRYTDVIDGAILKIVKAPIRKVKVS